jgi:glycosyltransferase involved in cell wall biosynthesis
MDDYGLPKEKICVAGAGVNYRLDPLPHKAYDGQTILFIGREFDLKGGPLIVEAFRSARQALPQAKLVIIGCTPPIREPGIEIAGPISKDVEGGLERILTYFSEASLFCLMSSFEAFGIALVEAMHCGVPCVVPKRYAFQEIVVDNVTGRHILAPDPSKLSRVFVELLSDPRRLEEMGKAGKEHVKKHYTWDAAAKCIHHRIQQDLIELTSVRPERLKITSPLTG